MKLRQNHCARHQQYLYQPQLVFGNELVPAWMLYESKNKTIKNYPQKKKKREMCKHTGFFDERNRRALFVYWSNVAAPIMF